MEEVQKHEQLEKHPNLVEFVQAWEEQEILYIQTELCQTRLVYNYWFLLSISTVDPISVASGTENYTVAKPMVTADCLLIRVG